MAKRVIPCIFISIFIIAVFYTSIHLAKQPDPSFDRIIATPSILEMMESINVSLKENKDGTEPDLIIQAKRFGLYLNPPPSPQTITPPKTNQYAPHTNKSAVTKKLPTKPKQSLPKFKVLATSVYKTRPEKTMALIVEPGAESRWIKAGQMVGHLLMERIERGHVAWRLGEETGRVAVDMTSKVEYQQDSPGVTLVAKISKTNSVPESEPIQSRPSRATPIRRGLRQRR